MNIITLVLAIVVGGLQLGDDSTAHEVNGNNRFCITAEKIIRPIASWRVLKTEIKYVNKLPYLEVTVHNPLNKKTPTSIDAKFVLSIDPVTPSDTQKYNLMMATYYNTKANVVFRRIYSLHEVTVKNKVRKFPMQTPCFAREVTPILQIEETEITVPSPPDGGTK